MTYYLVCYLVWVMTLQKQNLKKQFIISLIFGFLIFLAICIEEFFANSSVNLILFTLGLGFLSSTLIFICFLIANVLKINRILLVYFFDARRRLLQPNHGLKNS